jgi:hypothetical protein
LRQGSVPGGCAIMLGQHIITGPMHRILMG